MNEIDLKSIQKELEEKKKTIQIEMDTIFNKTYQYMEKQNLEVELLPDEYLKLWDEYIELEDKLFNLYFPNEKVNYLQYINLILEGHIKRLNTELCRYRQLKRIGVKMQNNNEKILTNNLNKLQGQVEELQNEIKKLKND